MRCDWCGAVNDGERDAILRGRCHLCCSQHRKLTIEKAAWCRLATLAYRRRATVWGSVFECEGRGLDEGYQEYQDAGHVWAELGVIIAAATN